MRIHGIDLSTYTIVIRDEKIPQLLTARSELSNYLIKYYPSKDKETGFKIFIGFDDDFLMKKVRNLPDPEGFVIVIKDRNLYITGTDDTMTLYGTYYFIEKYLGVNWLSLDCEYFEPQDIDMDTLDIAHSYPLMLRYCHNFNGLNPIFRARHRANYTVGDTNDTPSYGGIRGIKYAFSWGLFGHTFEILLPYEVYYRDHPEYYSFSEKHPGENHRYQICLTNPAVLEIVTANALNYLDQHPGVKVISISQNDSYFDFQKNYCLCEGCAKILEQEGAYSGVLINFVNQVADRIKEKYPEVLVHTFAYHFTEEPPKHIKPRDNVVVQFCVHLPKGYRLDDGVPLSEVEKNKIDIWSTRAKNLFAWTYLIEHSDYFMPIGNIENLYYNTRYLVSRGVKGIFQQENSDFNNINFSELRAYLVCKLFDEPHMSFDDYLGYVQKFCRGYYGDIGGHILAYINLLDQKYRFVNTNPFTHQDKIAFLGDQSFITKANQLLKSALKNVKETVFKDRIEKMRMQVKYCELYDLFQNMESDAEIASYAKKRKAFVQTVVDYGITTYREGSDIPALTHIDYTKAPDLYSKKDQVIDLELGTKSQWFSSLDCTKEDGVSFRFQLAQPDENALEVKVKVQGDHSYCIDDNILDWAQDCVEIYLSEDFNRTNRNLAHDYVFRINANGVAYCRDQNKIQSVHTKKTQDGYTVHLIINLNSSLKSNIMGFEVLAHDFRGGKYDSTAYWNAFKGSQVYSAPHYYGVLRFKER